MSKIDVEESIIYMFKDKNDCVSYEWRELMKVDVIDVEESIVYRFDSRDDLVSCVQSLGEQGFFSDDEDFHHHVYDTLCEVKCLLEETKYPFVRRSSNEIKVEYKYFIPADAVVFKEKPEYRPYSFMYELPFNKVGDVIKIRNKNQELITYTVVNSVSVDIGNKVLHLIIGTTPGTPQYWFDTIEICVNDKWQPFGVEE